MHPEFFGDRWPGFLSAIFISDLRCFGQHQETFYCAGLDVFRDGSSLARGGEGVI
jgi:hypothetical protein